MRILVTGSTGFVGRHLLPKLIEAEHEVIELTIEPEVSNKLYGKTTSKIEVPKKQTELVAKIEHCKPDIVIHLASYLTPADDFDTMEKLLSVNIMFFCRLLDALKKCDLKLFINTGTSAEYFKGDGVFEPAYLYAATKTASRSFLNYYSTVYNFKQFTVVPYTIYGGNDTQKKIIDVIFDSLDSSIPVDLSPGEQVLDFIHVDDVANFYVYLVDNMEKIENKANFQLGTGRGTTLKQLARIIEQKSGKKANINWGGKPYRPSDVMYAVADTQLQQKLMNNLKLISIEQGVESYLLKRKTV